MARAKIAPTTSRWLKSAREFGAKPLDWTADDGARMLAEIEALLAVARAVQAAPDEMAFGVNVSVERALARLRRVSGGGR